MPHDTYSRVMDLAAARCLQDINKSASQQGADVVARL
jgi:hypothetical protein